MSVISVPMWILWLVGSIFVILLLAFLVVYTDFRAEECKNKQLIQALNELYIRRPKRNSYELRLVR